MLKFGTLVDCAKKCVSLFKTEAKNVHIFNIDKGSLAFPLQILHNYAHNFYQHNGSDPTIVGPSTSLKYDPFTLI